jgi:hypothetical protein
MKEYHLYIILLGADMRSAVKCKWFASWPCVWEFLCLRTEETWSSTNFKTFWRWCITLRIIEFLALFHRLIFRTECNVSVTESVSVLKQNTKGVTISVRSVGTS